MADYIKLTDRELTEQLRSGEAAGRAAFTEIYNRYWSPLYLHARRLLQHQDHARDAVQEVFTVLWNNASDFELSTSLGAYLHRSIKNSILNLIRHEKVAGSYLDKLAKVYNEGNFSTDEQINLNELQRLIEREIQLLPAEIRKVFEMSRKQHLSAAEIAIQLNKSPETVKKQISRALQILRKRMNLPGAMLIILLSNLK